MTLFMALAKHPNGYQTKPGETAPKAILGKTGPARIKERTPFRDDVKSQKQENKTRRFWERQLFKRVSQACPCLFQSLAIRLRLP